MHYNTLFGLGFLIGDFANEDVVLEMVLHAVHFVHVRRAYGERRAVMTEAERRDSRRVPATHAQTS